MNPPKYSKSLFVLLVAASLCMGENSKAQITWDGGGADNKWGTAANWSGGVAPVSGSALVFDGSVQTSNNNNITGTPLVTITFNSTAGAFTLSGNVIKFNAAVGITDYDQTYTETVNTNITLASSSNRSIDVVAGGTVSLGGIISGSSGLTISGTMGETGGGTVILGNANTYFGPTIVNAGTLLLDNGTVGTGTGAVTVAGTLGGSGSIKPSAGKVVIIQSGGVLAPGLSGGTGVLTLDASINGATTGLLTVASGATLNFNLGAGNAASSMNLTSSFLNEVVLNGNTFNFTDLTAGSLSTGLYTLFSTDDSTSNPFSGLSTGTLSGFTLNGLSAYTAAGDTVQLQLNQLAGSGDYALQLDLVAAPEPGSCALMAGGLTLLAIFQFRRLQTRRQSH